MNCPYRKIAADRWKGVEISGHGRYALVDRKDGIAVAVYLTANEEAAKASQPFYDSVLYDLQPTPCPDLKDDWEDRRRDRRESRTQ